MVKDVAELNASISNPTVGEQEKKVPQFIPTKYDNYEKILYSIVCPKIIYTVFHWSKSQSTNILLIKVNVNVKKFAQYFKMMFTLGLKQITEK